MFLRTLILPLFSLVLMTNSAHAISLKEAVSKTIRNNPNGKADAANLRAVAGELRQSQTAFQPTVSVFGDIGVQRRDNAILSATSNAQTETLLSREIGVRASLVLFDGLERANIVYRNAARLDGATFRLLAGTETLGLNAVEAYIDVVRHQRLVSITKSNIRRHKEILSQIRQRVEGGKAPASDLIQIQERVLAAEIVSVEVENALEDAKVKFKKVVGQSAKGKMRIPGVKGLPRSRQQLVRTSVFNNYNIKQAQKNIREFEFEREAARGALKPRVSLDGRASTGRDRQGTRGSESDLYVGLTLSWRLYDGGLRNARENTFSERVSEAHFRQDATVRDVTALAERTWNSHVSNSKRSSILRSQVSSNLKIVKNYREEYQLSKRSLLDVLDAERARFNSQFQQISAEAAMQFSSYRMLASMSRLASHFGISASAVAPTPNFEERVFEKPQEIFDITIQPLQ